jgi:hypothetical protein
MIAFAAGEGKLKPEEAPEDPAFTHIMIFQRLTLNKNRLGIKAGNAQHMCI